MVTWEGEEVRVGVVVVVRWLVRQFLVLGWVCTE
jgi:hypothetical protein